MCLLTSKKSYVSNISTPYINLGKGINQGQGTEQNVTTCENRKKKSTEIRRATGSIPFLSFMNIKKCIHLESSLKISKKIKGSHVQALPDHILQALQAWAMVTKDRTASDSSFGSSFKEVWSKRKRDMFFGSNFNPLATKFTGFSVCHPLHANNVMLNMVRHAIYSSLFTESATATVLLLPNWKGLDAKAYMRCLENIQSIVLSWALFPRHQWPIADKIYGLETIQALQLLSGILKLLLYGIKKHNTCYLIGTQGGVQPCLMPYPRQFSSHSHIQPLWMRQR